MARRISGTERSTLTERAVRAAAKTRLRASLDQYSPICVYDLCTRLGVSVRFNDLDMEGMYQKASRPIIHLSARRPLGRRAFNCAHELGHHVFEHGSAVDELKERSILNSWDNPEELLADTFAAHLLMPAIGVRGAFNRRKIDPEEATPTQVYAIACEFGVGYTTLVTQMTASLNLLSKSRARELNRLSPKKIRELLLDEVESTHLVVAGPSGNAAKVDLEVGSHLLIPQSSFVDAEKLVPMGKIRNGSLFVARTPGTTSITAKHWRTEVRISRKHFVGLAKYRHLEEAA